MLPVVGEVVKLKPLRTKSMTAGHGHRFPEDHGIEKHHGVVQPGEREVGGPSKHPGVVPLQR